MGAVCGIPHCKPDCELTSEYHRSDFKHISEFQNSSVAPWKMSVDAVDNREPSFIEYAECKDCTLKNLVSKPIMIQVFVFEKIRIMTGSAWCKCPFNLAVGCTCVEKQ
ncbi:hypothetical protein PBY51_000948 [Eleginops maclovinus]|uniref:Uncharacterized protein n=1 Tax=Eleginops maclovinus TaxID=56733 RepID=A0AAN8APP1_ELEMC|nr:hypothetical protein PBY51_000948 [Eleginops maclovinus]